MKHAIKLAGILLIGLFAGSDVVAQGPGWPRKNVQTGGTLITYQPQVDDWKNFTTIIWRQAFQPTPNGAKQVIGAATMTGTTNVDNDKYLVTVYGIQVTNSYFPDLDPATSAKMDQLLRTFVPPLVNISLARVVACVPKPKAPPTNTVNVKSDVVCGNSMQAASSNGGGSNMRKDCVAGSSCQVKATVWSEVIKRPAGPVVVDNCMRTIVTSRA